MSEREAEYVFALGYNPKAEELATKLKTIRNRPAVFCHQETCLESSCPRASILLPDLDHCSAQRCALRRSSRPLHVRAALTALARCCLSSSISSRDGRDDIDGLERWR